MVDYSLSLRAILKNQVRSSTVENRALSDFTCAEKMYSGRMDEGQFRRHLYQYHLYLRFCSTLHAVELPHIKIENGAGQLLVKGEPFLILAGELGNSSARSRG